MVTLDSSLVIQNPVLELDLYKGSISKKGENRFSEEELCPECETLVDSHVLHECNSCGLIMCPDCFQSDFDVVCRECIQ